MGKTVYAAQEREKLFDIQFSSGKPESVPIILLILTSHQIIQLDGTQFKHVKLQQKTSYFGSTILKASQHAALISDPLQGVQIVSMPNLQAVKTWKFPFLLEKQFKTLWSNEGETMHRLYLRQGVLVESKQGS